MIYIDIDNTLADFDNWIYQHNDKAKNDIHLFFKTMYKYYKTCFLESKLLYENIEYDIPVFTLLTTLPNEKSIESFISSNESIKDIMNTFEMNKKNWANNYFPNKNIIITTNRLDKVKYCKPGDILIDDSKSTGKAWCTAGGIYYESITKYLNQDATIFNIKQSTKNTNNISKTYLF